MGAILNYQSCLLSQKRKGNGLGTGRGCMKEVGDVSAVCDKPTENLVAVSADLNLPCDVDKLLLYDKAKDTLSKKNNKHLVVVVEVGATTISGSVGLLPERLKCQRQRRSTSCESM
jgi:hypothetical protein